MFNFLKCNIKITQCLINFWFTIYDTGQKSLKVHFWIKNWDLCKDIKSCTVHCLIDDTTINQWEFRKACIIKTS